jgi:hypothetical protein
MLVFDDALEVIQQIRRGRDVNKHVFYLTAMKTEKLVKEKEDGVIKPDQWDRKSNPDGYQRVTDHKRAGKIRDFLVESILKEIFPLMPQAVILNIRKGKAEFQPHTKGAMSGKLIIHDNLLPLWEIDGQHRIEGLWKANSERERELEFGQYEMCLL